LSPEQLAEIRELNALAAPPRLCRNDQERVRLDHAAQLRSHGLDPWPAAEAPVSLGDQAVVAGRVRRMRDHGGVVFADVTTAATPEVPSRQVLLEEDHTHGHEVFARLVDIGDLVRFVGTPGRSRSGEPSLLVKRWEMLAKSLHPMPVPARAADPVEPGAGGGARRDRV
jgi:lysyl-tRNA synthetase class 2